MISNFLSNGTAIPSKAHNIHIRIRTSQAKQHKQSQTTPNTRKMNTAFDANTAYSNNIISGTFQLLDIPMTFNNGVDYLIIRGASHQQRPATMPDTYIPTDWDVLCGRGKQNWKMTGNVNFRMVIRASVARYVAAPSKADKTAVIVSVVDKIRRQGGHFLKEQRQHQQQYGSSCSSCWYDIGDAAARDKVGHSLRDQVGSSNPNSAAKSPLQLAKKQQAKRIIKSAGDCGSFDSDAAVVARLVDDTSSLSSLSCLEEEMIVDSFLPDTTLSRRPSLVPIDISSLVWGADLLAINSSPLSLSDFLDCFDV
jgi:hypothetical protein